MPELIIHPRHEKSKGLQVKWEVRLYRIPRHLECYGHVFETKGEAMQYASLEMANPNWSQVVVHCVLAQFC